MVTISCYDLWHTARSLPILDLKERCATENVPHNPNDCDINVITPERPHHRQQWRRQDRSRSRDRENENISSNDTIFRRARRANAMPVSIRMPRRSTRRRETTQL